MYQLTIDPFLLVRSPAYSYENFSEHFLRQVLSTDFFRASLFFASQTLYLELKKKDFDYDQITQNAKVTLWKYLNRMCYRSLPYGFFSSYSLGAWAKEGDSLLFTNDDKMIVHPDFKVVVDYITSLDPEDLPDTKYYTNNSLYQLARELRFISQIYPARNKFAIVEIRVAPGLNKLLRFISKGQTKAAIISFLKQEYGEDVPAEGYFKTLMSGQVILSELTPNVTGINFSHRCDDLLRKHGRADLNVLKSFEINISSQQQPLPHLNEFIDELIDRNIENSTYSLYQREVCGGISSEVQADLLALIKNMDKLTAGQPIDIMKTFKADFLQKYDQQEIPLMVVLDPGSGIGYEDLASAFVAEDNDFIDDLRARDHRQGNASWGPVEKMIFRKWNSLPKAGMEKIILTADDMLQLPESKHSLPPGMFVLFKKIDKQIWVEAIGGTSGIELSARFGGTGSGIQANLKRICEEEVAINGDFIFAEIAFSPNDRTSNINQRGHFYKYEIPILTHSTYKEEDTIKLSDLVISVRDDKVLLRSVKHNKYVIPRLSSAYNYKISTIPVFRFLCDLQFQGVKAGMSFSLVNLFPGMEYYPRVQLENSVLSPATWILNEEQLKKIIAQDGPLPDELNLPSFFSLIEGDNFLIFNKNNNLDLEIFRKCIKNKKTAKLAEHIFPREADLKNGMGQSFTNQLVACVINQVKSYKLPNHQVMKVDKGCFKVKRSFLPGEEWLYLKLYAHYSLTDEILTNFVLPVIKKYKKDNAEFKWFFIRYQDPGHHLRLRFFTGGKPSYALLSDLIRKLQPWCREGKISDVILDSYQRELEKYSAGLISEVESFFYWNSEYILSVFLGNELNTSFKLSFAVNSTLQIIRFFIDDQKERTDFLNAVLNNLSPEFSSDKEVVRKLDTKYRKFQSQLISHQQYLYYQRKNRAYKYYDQQVHELADNIARWDKVEKYNLLINLIHMHINRIFEHTPREYEFLIYHFMKKHQAYLNHTTAG